jgi:hypothetical protein
MKFHDMFASNGNPDDLPRPNAKMRTNDDEGEWTPEQTRGVVGNPIYAGIGPYPPLIDDGTWVRAAAAMIQEEGKEQFLVNLLYLLRQAFENASLSMRPDNGNSAPLLSIHNHHSSNCGTPPQVDDRSLRQYTGYFENPFGEQWVFAFDRDTREATLRGGDIGWDRVCQVRNGRVAGIILGREEQTWLAACWEAATLGLVGIDPAQSDPSP